MEYIFKIKLFLQHTKFWWEVTIIIWNVLHSVTNKQWVALSPVLLTPQLVIGHTEDFLEDMYHEEILFQEIEEEMGKRIIYWAFP